MEATGLSSGVGLLAWTGSLDAHGSIGEIAVTIEVGHMLPGEGSSVSALNTN